MTTSARTVRIAAVGDIHCTRKSAGQLRALFADAAAHADVLLLCGDVVDYGLAEEAQVLAAELQAGLRIPAVAVLGNHEWESQQVEQVRQILCDAGVIVLDGDTCEVAGVGFAGAKGFAGGFGRWALEPWGEETIKRFVHEAVDEALKLEAALARLRTPQRVALLHYAPIRATVEGESPEIFPFLGSSRLEEPLNRYPVAAVFHGHAHGGSLEGKTSAGVPVYNVALPVLRRAFPNRLPYRVLELPLDSEEEL
jgi:Icc-related predicted phosphoesterase